jgi:SAM-dependent methyltransferase
MTPDDLRSLSGALCEPYVGPRHTWRVDLLARVLGGAVAGESGPLVDVGCGDGTLALALARAGWTVLAFDPDPIRLAWLQAHSARAGRPGQPGRILIFRADSSAIPLRYASVAGAAAGEVLEHIARDDLALREIARVLAPGGVIALTVPAGPGRMGAADRAAGHARRYDRAMLVALIEDAGLRVELLRGWGFPFGRLYDRWVQRPALAARGLGGGPAGPLAGGIARLGRARWMIALWRGLFVVDERLAGVGAGHAGSWGSGWVAVGKQGIARSRPGAHEELPSVSSLTAAGPPTDDRRESDLPSAGA